MYAASLGMLHTGLAEILGDQMVGLAIPFGPLGLAAGAYLFSALLTQIMGGQVTALVSGPIAISAAIGMGVNPQAVAVAAAIGCSASFLTPFAHPVNIIDDRTCQLHLQGFFPCRLAIDAALVLDAADRDGAVLEAVNLFSQHTP